MRVFWQTKRSDSFDPGIFQLFLNNRRIEFVRPQKRYLQQIKSKLASLSDDSRSDLVIPLSVQCECVNSVFGHEVRVSGFWFLVAIYKNLPGFKIPFGSRACFTVWCSARFSAETA